ncbi:squalene/phytoene synthase family protein, partial [Calothrix rhizosoleniae]|uniref:squalene/phytoene synthase family protein n=1 Tax=Calothrix rhizosoleniae TaxID=888997 RepID=UPI0013565416
MLLELNLENRESDAIKDLDSAGFVLNLESEIRDKWLERVSWLRLVDQLAESEFIDCQGTEYNNFVADWKLLLNEGIIPVDSSFEKMLNQIRNSWFANTDNIINSLCIQSFDSHIMANVQYHQPNLEIHTLNNYQIMLENLSGTAFQILPFLTPEHWQLVYYLGTVDQFYNNLRDIHEDAERDICYFPLELLNEFGVTREEICQMEAFRNTGYHRMINFWLDEYLVKIREKLSKFILVNNLHPSWIICRDWCLQRYSRIEQVFRECNFD